MILVETESENSDDDNLQESNCQPCPSASDTPDFKVSCKATFVALSTVTSGHPYGNKRMTLVHLRQIDGNWYKITEDVDPSAEYRFRKVETEMDNLILIGLNFGSRKLPRNKLKTSTEESNEDFRSTCSMIYLLPICILLYKNSLWNKDLFFIREHIILIQNVAQWLGGGK